VPVREIDRGEFPSTELFVKSGAFGGLILEGMVLQRLQLGTHTTMKIHGPGDLLARVTGPGSTLVSAWTMSAAQTSRIALFGGEVLAAFRRWPALAAGFHARMGEQAERLAVQLAICQLPRVEERLLALMWWLAESWGRVTSVGTLLPVAMTHDVLGALVGARRPTVTLAIGELVERGAIARQDRGWLLLEAPPAPPEIAPSLDDPTLIAPGENVWVNIDEETRWSDAEHATLLEHVARLRTQHTTNAAEVSERLAALRATRETLSRRRQLASHRWAPS
jgi:CRP-like cAMP-binding protein